MQKKVAKKAKNLNELAEKFVRSQLVAPKSDPWFEPGSQDRHRLDWGKLTQRVPAWDFHPSNEELDEMRGALDDPSLAEAPVGSEERAWWRKAAWYQPMHCHNDGEWGIYFSESAIRRAPEFFVRFAGEQKEEIKNNLADYFSKFCLAAAVSLFLRELFRHRLECFAIRLTSLTSSPCYAAWRSALDAALEERLATAYAYRRLDEDTYVKNFGKYARTIVKKGLRILTSKICLGEKIKNGRSLDIFGGGFKYEFEQDPCSSETDFQTGCDRLLEEICQARQPSPTNPVELSLVRSAIVEEFDLEDLKQSRLWILRERSSSSSALTSPIQSPCALDARQEVPVAIGSWLQHKQELLAPGKTLPSWPDVCISDEDPPLFVSDPRLKEWYEEDRSEEDGQRGPEWDGRPDFERFLAVYLWGPKQIIIWRKGVDCCSKLLNIDYDALFDCVLIHELGHWFNAEAHTSKGITWNLATQTWTRSHAAETPGNPDWRRPDVVPSGGIIGNARSLSSRSYHEVWAQFFAWLYGHEVSSQALTAFQKLEPRQSQPYQAWRKLVSDQDPPANLDYKPTDLRFKEEIILRSLEWSRGLGRPVTFDDPQCIDTNMLEYLNEERFIRSIKSQKVGSVIRKL